MTRKHTSLDNCKSLNPPRPLLSLREQVGGPGVCIHLRGWKNQLFDSQTHPPPKVRDPGQVLCKGPDLFVKHFDVLSFSPRAPCPPSHLPVGPLAGWTGCLQPSCFSLMLQRIWMEWRAGAMLRKSSGWRKGGTFLCVFWTTHPPPFPWCQRFASWAQLCSCLSPPSPLCDCRTSSCRTLLGPDGALF